MCVRPEDWVARLRDETGSAVMSAVLVMPMVATVMVMVLGVIVDASRVAQLRTAATAAAAEAAVQPTLTAMRDAASRRVRRDFPQAQIAVTIEVAGGLRFARVSVSAPLVPVPGLERIAMATATSHAVVESW